MSTPSLPEPSKLVGTVSSLFTKTRVGNKLTLAHLGLLVVKNLSFLLKSYFCKNYNFMFKLKKHKYSFLRPNQAKKIHLRRKTLIVLYQLLDNLKYNISPLGEFNYEYFPLTYLQNFKKSYNNLVNQKLPPSLKPNLTTHLDTFQTSHIFEVKLPRIKFKPGYSRLWREARVALKDSISVKFLYQQQLTKYIHRFYRKTLLNQSTSQELTFDKVLIYSRLVPDYTSFIAFFRSNAFFVNGRLPTSPQLNCVVNDFIQLVVSKWYYIFFR
jgi:hypothetical protein